MRKESVDLIFLVGKVGIGEVVGVNGDILAIKGWLVTEANVA